jgi:hypothetical protein
LYQRGFRCNAFEENPDWQLTYAATLPEAKRAILNWLKRNQEFTVSAGCSLMFQA